jgi:hypothetical protein
MQLSGYVYFIGPALSGPVKIGSSGAPARRLKSLQAGSPVPLALLAHFADPDAMSAEKALHRRFSALRLHGEWFQRTPELEVLMESCRSGPGVGLLDPSQAQRVVEVREAARLLGVPLDAMRKRAHRSHAEPVGRKGNALLYHLGDLV